MISICVWVVALNPEGLFVSGHLNGAVINLRGHAQIDSGAIGRIDLQYGNAVAAQSPGETRAYNSFKSTRGFATGGLTLMPGDATFDLTDFRRPCGDGRRRSGAGADDECLTLQGR